MAGCVEHHNAEEGENADQGKLSGQPAQREFQSQRALQSQQQNNSGDGAVVDEFGERKPVEGLEQNVN